VRLRVPSDSWKQTRRTMASDVLPSCQALHLPDLSQLQLSPATVYKCRALYQLPAYRDTCGPTTRPAVSSDLPRSLPVCVGNFWIRLRRVFPLPFIIQFTSSFKALSSTKQYLLIQIQSAATSSRWFLARGFFYPEDRSDTFLRNVGSHKVYTTRHPRRRHSS
jgi:hypothetical protein